MEGESTQKRTVMVLPRVEVTASTDCSNRSLTPIAYRPQTRNMHQSHSKMNVSPMYRSIAQKRTTPNLPRKDQVIQTATKVRSNFPLDLLSRISTTANKTPSPGEFSKEKATNRTFVVNNSAEIDKLKTKLRRRDEQIEKLQSTVKTLQAEVSSLKSSNNHLKAALKCSELLQVAPVVEVSKELNDTRFEATLAKKELQDTKNDNYKLRAVINKLKRINESSYSSRARTPHRLTIRSSDDSFGSLFTERSEDLATIDKDAAVKKQNRFLLFRHFLEDIKKAPTTSSIVSKLIKDLPQIIPYDLISVIVLNKNMKLPKGFDFQNDCHCKFHKIRCLRMWVDVIYDKRGFSEPAFNTLEKVRPGFRTYFDYDKKIVKNS